MSNQIEQFRAVITQDEHQFGTLLGKVLSPSRPLHSEEYLRGRAEQLGGIKKALYAQGRHVLIHGFRGVGKSSLAQTAAFGMAIGADPVIIGCDKSSTLASAMRDVFDEALNKNPAIEKKIRETSSGLSAWGLTLGGKTTTTEGRIAEPSSINEAVRLMQFLGGLLGERPIVVVDEFDQIQSKTEQEHLTAFIKQVSDKHVSVRIHLLRDRRVSRGDHVGSW